MFAFLKSTNFFLVSIICLFFGSTFHHYIGSGIFKYLSIFFLIVNLTFCINKQNIIYLFFPIVYIILRFFLGEDSAGYNLKLLVIISIFLLIFLKMKTNFKIDKKKFEYVLFFISYFIIFWQYIWKSKIHFYLIYELPDIFLRFPLFVNKNHFSLFVTLSFCYFLIEKLKKSNLAFLLLAAPYILFFTNSYAKLLVLAVIIFKIFPLINNFFNKKICIIFILLIISIIPMIYKSDKFIIFNYHVLNKVNNHFLKKYPNQTAFSCKKISPYKVSDLMKSLCFEKNLYGFPKNLSWTMLHSVLYRIHYSNLYVDEIIKNKNQSIFLGLTEKRTRYLENKGNYIHNSYLSNFVRYGVLGYFLGFAFIFYIMIKDYKENNKYKKIVLPYSCLMIFDPYLFGYKIELTIFFLLIILLMNSVKNENIN